VELSLQKLSTLKWHPWCRSCHGSPRALACYLEFSCSGEYTWWQPSNLYHTSLIMKATSRYVSIQSTIIKHHKLVAHNNRNLFLPVLEAWKSKIKRPADSVFDEGPLSRWCLQVASYIVKRQARSSLEPLLLRALTPNMKVLLSWANHLQRVPIS
jgi:hypothetical protein